MIEPVVAVESGQSVLVLDAELLLFVLFSHHIDAFECLVGFLVEVNLLPQHLLDSIFLEGRLHRGQEMELHLGLLEEHLL